VEPTLKLKPAWAPALRQVGVQADENPPLMMLS
jgi:hypothetical protein